ncbi:MAG TPA: serine protease [Rhodobacteraceae bacterium]|nr:serine protease [Paracoccaceae bacterium]
MFRTQFITARRLAVGTGTAAALAITALPAQAHEGHELADLVERVSPSVVTVLSRVAAQVSPAHGPASPLEEFFRRGAPRPAPQPQSGLGSGFILDSEEGEAWIVTNNHVVEGADSVTIRLGDGREYDAQIVGLDPATDLAVLRIETGGIELPELELGSSDELRVGEEVFAVGNPFGLGGTVTKGIVSAKGRDINAGPYADFIQTDAAINRGNSGGPLFNMEGDVVGVNSAIYSPNGGSVGLGFAVAADIVDKVVADLRDDGEISRGWLGVQIQDVTPELAEAMGLEDHKGALISDVVEDSPAKGALQVGDVVLGFDGKDVDNSRALPKLVGATTPGETVELDLLRDGEKVTVEIEIGTLAQLAKAETRDAPEDTRKLGATVSPLTDAARAQLGLDGDVQGTVITSVGPDSAAARAGLRAGDVIVKLDGTETASPEALKQALEGAGDKALALVNRRGSQIFVPLKLG